MLVQEDHAQSQQINSLYVNAGQHHLGPQPISICASYFSLITNMLLKILQYVYSSCPTAIHFATQHVAHHFT